MKAKALTAILAAFMLTMTACGTISPPLQTTTETTTATAESVLDSAASSEAESTVDEEQVKSDTFMAEFFDSNISFADVSEIVTESLKGSNGGGSIEVMCIDLSKSSLSYDMEYILENFGDHYFRQTAAQMNGITEDDFVSDYRMTSSVVSKGKYQRYASVQKTDGMASQFGYTETYAVLSENKLTIVSGAFLSSDMMERQSFSQVMGQFRECVGG
jgi:hypothetical protein